MSLRYKKKKIVLCFDKENKVEKYVAANVLAGSLNYKKLCNEVNQRTGIHRSMVDVVLKGLQDTMVSFLEEGFSVKLDEFGSFRPAINAESQDKEDDVNAHTIIRRKSYLLREVNLRQCLVEQVLNCSEMELQLPKMAIMVGHQEEIQEGKPQTLLLNSFFSLFK